MGKTSRAGSLQARQLRVLPAAQAVAQTNPGARHPYLPLRRVPNYCSIDLVKEISPVRSIQRVQPRGAVGIRSDRGCRLYYGSGRARR
jgi:hypothetical protein